MSHYSVPLRSARGFGAYAAERRVAQGLTQADLAAKVGVSRKWVVRFEDDSTTATLFRAVRVFQVLGIDLAATPSNTNEVTD
ncbi:helix-turn-helix domain-containing protein [Lysinibacter cavernae]|uniref:helix-turn-helix domain-containing protein n=1 Tax=Lysinibacter cavernae TaxID=1640652 RepID=UPI00362254D5